MWPTLLNLSRDECRRALRRLELDAYSNMINVLRAQGALADNRKKLLEELRVVLHIGGDRHNAEARRVSNDEILATIAEQLTGPNTGLGWVCEGRRLVPLLPRGVAQTMYTEIADTLSEVAQQENAKLEKKLEAEELAASQSNEEELTDTEVLTAEGTQMMEPIDEFLYPPIAMEDHSSKIWETELICRKRKIPEGGASSDDTATPVKNMRNIPASSNQKHLNLSQIYSKYSQPATSKSSSQSKHSYNQVSKVSTSKTSQPHQPRATQHKHRSHRQSSKNPTQVTSKPHKKTQELSPSKQYNSASMHMEYSGTPNSFQASYAQSILSGKKSEFIDEMKPKVLSSPGLVTDSPTMQLLTQPTTVPLELGVSDNAHPDDPISLQAHSTPVKQINTSKPCHLILKKRGDITHTSEKKVQMPEFKILQKPDGVKVISSRQVVVGPSSTHKVVNTANKVNTTKVIGSIPKTRPTNTHVISEKMIVVSKPSMDNRIVSNSKIIVTSSAVSTHSKEHNPVSANCIVPKTSETLTAKGIPATDLKVSAKTFVLNPKSGQKMVVVPAKNRTKSGNEGQMPLLHFKGIPTAMKLVPVSSQPASQAQMKSAPVTVVSRPAVVNTIPSNAKIVSVEPIKTANLADIVPVKGLAPVTTSKMTNPIVRPGSAKGSLIVVPKGTTIGKTLKFTKNGNDTKIIMGKNVNKLIQSSKSEQVDTSKCAGNVIVLELNNEQTGRTTTMSEILDSRHTNSTRVPQRGKQITHQEITEDTPVLFDSQLTEDCNTNSLDSASESIADIVRMGESNLRIIDKDDVKSNLIKDMDGTKDSSRVTDWEMELDTVSKKGKDDDDKLNSLHLDLGMSSDSENEYMADSSCQQQRLSQESIPRSTASGHSDELFSSSRSFSLATRTFLSQLQDDGSSSNDSSFTLKSKSIDKGRRIDKIDRSESEALFKAKEKLTEKVAEATSQQKRIDIYSTAITSSDINLDSFSYLDEGMMVGDDVFGTESKREARRSVGLDDHLSRLLGEDSANSTDSQTAVRTTARRRHQKAMHSISY